MIFDRSASNTTTWSLGTLSEVKSWPARWVLCSRENTGEFWHENAQNLHEPKNSKGSVTSTGDKYVYEMNPSSWIHDAARADNVHKMIYGDRENLVFIQL